MKKVLSVLLSLVMTLTLLPGFTAVAAEAEEIDFVLLSTDLTAPACNEPVTQPEFTVDYCDADVSVAGVWEYGGDGKWMAIPDATTFTAGEWRYRITVNMEPECTADYYFAAEVDCIVDDDEWTVLDVADDSFIAVSPSYALSDHNWDADFTIDEPATCTKPGSKSKHCSDPGCDEVTEVTVIPATGHSFVHGVCGTCGARREGDCGDDATWFYDNTDGVLTISGTGDMKLTGITNTYSDMADIVKTVVIEDGITSVCASAFTNFKKLNSVTIANSVTNIGANAFQGCTALTTIVIPSGVTRVGISAFSGCTALKGVSIPNTVTSLGDNIFNGCTALVAVKIPDSVTAIGSYAFSGCTALTSVTLGNGIAAVPLYAFQNCTSIKNIVIQKGVTYIMAYAFSGCSKLASITVPGTLNQVGYKAFNGCKQLSNVHFDGCQDAYNQIGYVVSDIGGGIGDLIGGSIGDGNDRFKNATTTYGDHSVTVEEVTVKETCGTPGEIAHKCEYCNATFSTDVIPATGKHTYKADKKAATMSADGYTCEKCSACGKVRNKKTINKISSVKLSATKYVYNGKANTPTVTVKDSKGTKLANGSDYKLSYSTSTRKNVGKYTVTVTFIGKYSGSKSLSYVINPKGTTISKLTPASKSFTAKWKKQATQTSGYQIQYATNSKFTKNKKTVTVSKTGTVSKKITKLAAKKKYYVRIRTYRTVNGTKYYSAWSKTYSVTTKK